MLKILTQASIKSFERKCNRKKGYIAGWNKYVADAHRDARLKFKTWLTAGKPRNGEIFRNMADSRKYFKSKLKWCQDRQHQIKMDILASNREELALYLWKAYTGQSKRTCSTVSGLPASQMHEGSSLHLKRYKLGVKMVVLTESSLNKRHSEYNRKLAEAVANNVNFDDIKAEGDENDIDYLFKIDLASKYKNIDYILETLKSGDSLRISRALKCTWMYDSEYSHIINPQFINDNIFPHLSLKSKKKLINAISVHVRDAQRTLEFYEFCNSMKYENLAFKFLLFTSDETKIKLLRENCNHIDSCGWTYFRHFIGNSFKLAENYLELVVENQKILAIYALRYLYSRPDIGTKYLDLVEACIDTTNSYWDTHLQKFGLRMSKSIILKHKDRIYSKPRLYTNLINTSMFVRHSTVEDAKYYTTALMPDDPDEFWSINYYENKRHFFDIIPMDEKYQFIKKIFNDKYPGAPFEMTIHFYDLKYYNLITDLELKEEWALSHIASEKEILGPGKDYFWYRFIKFKKLFVEIKKYIKINIDPDIRTEVIKVLIESARNDRELETIFNYYYERHINEDKLRKKSFLDAVDQHHNIFQFDTNCFAALDKIYYSLELYNVLTTFYIHSEHQIICLVYRIINNMEMPEAMIKFMEDLPFCTLKDYSEKLMPEQKTIVFDYLLAFYLKRINSFNAKTYDDSVQDAVRRHLRSVLDLMAMYGKPKEELPEIVIKYVHLDWNQFKSHSYFEIRCEALTQDDMLRCIKRDTSEFLSKLPELKQRIKDKCRFRANRVVRKLRVYFSDDIAKKYLNFYQDVLNETDIDKHAVDIVIYGIIHLADKTYLEEFMTTHAPKDPKIDHVEVDRKQLSIQSAICALAGYARPAVPLSVILKYIKGDYTQYCRPLFDMYQANLQPKLCNKFIKSIVDAPLSVQKHGLRLAFKCYTIYDLSTLILETWKRTNNVSLRLIIYKALHSKIAVVNEDDAASLFEILNRFTSTVNEEDDCDLFYILTSDTMPEIFRSEHLKTVWRTFLNLPFNVRCIQYRAQAAMCLDNNICLIEPQYFIKNIVKEHIEYLFVQKRNKERYTMLKNGGLLSANWYLTAKYLTYLKDTERLNEKLNLTKYITSTCIKNWNEEIDDINVYRNLFTDFLYILKRKSYAHDWFSYKHVNVLFEYILKEIIEKLPMEEIYQITWDLKLNIKTREIITDANEIRTDENFLQTFKESAIRLGKVCVEIIKEYLEKNMFLVIYCDSIRDRIQEQAETIFVKLDSSCRDVETNDIIVLVCKELVEMKVFEPLLLVLKLFQNSYDSDGAYAAEYQNVVDQLKSVDNPQIKYYFYQKFIRNNSEGSEFI